MFILLAALAFAAIEQLPGKDLPSIKEPDWNAWRAAAPDAKEKANEAWAILSHHRPDHEHKTKDERRQAEERVDAAYKSLEANRIGACAAGAALIRASRDDWERIMIATTIKQLEGNKGDAFLLWAMANATTVEVAFEPVFVIAGELASTRRPQYLPAIFSVLRAHEGHVELPLHSWSIPTQECLFYVLGRYGREVIPYLYPMLKHNDPYVRRNAAIVLGYFMDKSAKPVMLEMLKANDIGSGGAAFALGQLGATDAIKPVAVLLKNPDAGTRFWAAFALFEIGSKDALPALEAAVANEKDEHARQEMTIAIAHVQRSPKPLGDGSPKLEKAELRKVLDKAEKANGLTGDVESIAASAGPEQLKQLEEIRLNSMNIPSDHGNKWFRQWTEVIKTIRRRSE